MNVPNLKYPFSNMKDSSYWKIPVSYEEIFGNTTTGYINVGEGKIIWNQYFKNLFEKREEAGVMPVVDWREDVIKTYVPNVEKEQMYIIAIVVLGFLALLKIFD